MPIPLHDEIVKAAQADARVLFDTAREDTRRSAAELKAVREEWRARLMTADPDEFEAVMAEADLNGIPPEEIALWLAGEAGREERGQANG